VLHRTSSHRRVCARRAAIPPDKLRGLQLVESQERRSLDLAFDGRGAVLHGIRYRDVIPLDLSLAPQTLNLLGVSQAIRIPPPGM
jgi:hypothetical protein